MVSGMKNNQTCTIRAKCWPCILLASLVRMRHKGGQSKGFADFCRSSSTVGGRKEQGVGMAADGAAKLKSPVPAVHTQKAAWVK